MIYGKRKFRATLNGETTEDMYHLEIDREWIAMQSMEKLDDWNAKASWLIKYRLAPHMELLTHLATPPWDQYKISISICQTKANLSCHWPVLNAALRMQGFIHPLPINRSYTNHYNDLIADLGAEEDSVVVMKTLTAVVMSRDKEVNTLLAIRSPEHILISDFYQRQNLHESESA